MCQGKKHCDCGCKTTVLPLQTSCKSMAQPYFKNQIPVTMTTIPTITAPVLNEVTISGKVVNEFDDPLVAAHIVASNGKGTITDAGEIIPFTGSLLRARLP